MPVPASPAARERHPCQTLIPGQGPKAPGPKAGPFPTLPMGTIPQSRVSGLRVAMQGLRRSWFLPKGHRDEFSHGSLEVSSGDAWDRQSPAAGQPLGDLPVPVPTHCKQAR